MAHSVTLNWVAPTTGDAVASYDIQRASSASGPWTTIGNVLAPTTTYVDADVVAGATDFYQVLAKNAAGESGASNDVSVTIPLAIPGSPSNLTAVAS